MGSLNKREKQSPVFLPLAANVNTSEPGKGEYPVENDRRSL